MDFVNSMAAREPTGETDDERTQDIGHMMEARVAAAEKLVRLPEGNQYQPMSARAKLESLRVLQMIGQAGANEKFAAYAQSLSESADEATAAVGRIGLFQRAIDLTMTGQNSGQSVVDGFQELMNTAGQTEPVFYAGQEAAMMLRHAGNAEDAVRLLQTLSAAFSDHESEPLAREARAVAKQARLLLFDAKFRETLMSGAGDTDDLVAMAHELLTEEAVDPTALAMIMQAAQQLEFSGKVDSARELYAKVASATKDSDQSDQVAADLESAQKRLDLLGRPFEVEGIIVGGDGEALDWEQYQGKVVLVDFWATWCGPCLQEVPNMKKNYARYQDLGFEIMGINLDSDLETVEAFLKAQPLPWPTVVSDQEDEFGFENPNAVRCGVRAIPFLVLVDQEGEVAALHVRDKSLDEKLAELLGQPEEEMLEITDPNEQEEPPHKSEDEMLEEVGPAAEAEPAPASDSPPEPAP
jgi:thiol-disulfide isomerase/thioredoxin